MFAFEFNDVNTLVVPTSKFPDTDKFAAVAVPVKIGLAKRFVFSCATTPPAIDSQVKVPQERSVVQTIRFAVVVPVKVGPAIGAFKFKVFSTLVVPASKAPDTVKSAAVAVPVKIGLAKRFVFSCATTPPCIDSQVKVQQERSVVQTIRFAVVVPVKVGPAIGAFRSKFACEAYPVMVPFTVRFPVDVILPFTHRFPSVVTELPPKTSPSGLVVLTPTSTFKSLIVVIPVRLASLEGALAAKAFVIVVA